MNLVASRRDEWMAAGGALVTALLWAAVFPPLEWTWAAWVALVPLLVMVRGLGDGRRALRLAWVAGFLHWLLAVRWLTHVTVGGWMVLAAYCALYVLPPVWLARRWRVGGLGFAASLAVVWSGCEFFRGWFGWGGFPWNPLGVGLTPWLPGVQLAEWGGVWLVSGLVVFVNGLVAWALLEWRAWRLQWRGLALGALAVAAVLGWGGWRVLRLEEADRVARMGSGRSIRVALVQTAIPQDEKWVSSKIRMIYSRLGDLTRQAQADSRTELIIWPETALPDDVRNSPNSYEVVWELVRHGPPILAGSLDVAEGEDGWPDYFNSAMLFDVQGRIAGAYNKRHLVVFGEFVPFERWVSPDWRVALGLPLSITPGERGAIFYAGRARVPLSPLICLEDIMPYLAGADVRAGARMLVNLTNDAWFDDRTVPNQHMRNAVLRAVENRVPLVRTANTGISCVIAPSGRVVSRLADGEGWTWRPGVLTADVAVPPNEMALTFYCRYGDMYGLACAVATGLWLAAAFWNRRNRRKRVWRHLPDT
ncbi:MAG: apolipoprotein N-acyltransferase [Kiritimatiellae bacterium]|nr:apolipoprotein N-acyltransferase [Kiritimatiellia bacterium]